MLSKLYWLENKRADPLFCRRVTTGSSGMRRCTKGGASGDPTRGSVLRQAGIHEHSTRIQDHAVPKLLWRRRSHSRVIRGCDGLVEIDEARRSVIKTYLHPDRATAVRNALREVGYASRLYEALAGVEGVACPRIIGWELSAPPRVVMNLCRGKNLSGFLRGTDAGDTRIGNISGKIQAGLEAYTRLFGEPYYDFCFNNMLFDEDSGTLTFLDFVIPQRPADEGLDTPLEASLGWLVGCACYTLARPAFLLASTAAYVGLMRSVIAGFDGRIRSERVLARARGTFCHMCDSGGRLRRSYYRTIGELVTDSCLGRLQREPASHRSIRTTVRCN